MNTGSKLLFFFSFPELLKPRPEPEKDKPLKPPLPKPQPKSQPKPQPKSQPKPEPKSQSKAKKATNRRSLAKKGRKNGISDIETAPPEQSPSETRTEPPGPAPLPNCDEAGGPSEEDTKPAGSSSPAHRLFQRTLSPADVLHVHSYAKGDYGEGEAPAKEERKSDNSSDSDTEEQRKSQVSEGCCNLSIALSELLRGESCKSARSGVPL